MSIKNRVAPRSDPWEMPVLSSRALEDEPLINTFRDITENIIIEKIFLVIP